jgi:hypothetical protein
VKGGGFSFSFARSVGTVVAFEGDVCAGTRGEDWRFLDAGFKSEKVVFVGTFILVVLAGDTGIAPPYPVFVAGFAEDEALRLVRVSHLFACTPLCIVLRDPLCHI